MLLKSFISAFSMYSAIPMPFVRLSERELRFTFCFFPMVGVVIGALVCFADMLLSGKVGNLLYSCIMSVIPVAVTGGIHFDGYVDTIDGICSYADKEKRLDILRDPHVGAFAVIGAAVYFVLSVGLWSEVRGKGVLFTAAGYCISRALSALSAVTLKCAKGTGLLAKFSGSSDRKAVIFSSVAYFAAALAALAFFDIRYALCAFLVSFVCFVCYGFLSRKYFGGVTGDTAGFFLQITELIFLLAAVLGRKLWYW